MPHFKRNQIEEAIAAALQQAGAEPDAALSIRMKRLLETDRALARDEAAGLPRPASAFYSGEAPGRGVEVWFSSYEAFALLMGVLLMQHRWPQGTAVRIMRQARPTLEPEHRRILSLDPEKLFDEAEVLRQAKPGSLGVNVTDSVFLAIVTTGRPEKAEPDAAPHALIVCRGEEELMRFRRERTLPGMSMTVVEVAGSAQLLAYHLSQTKPRTRGRSSR